MTRDLPCDERWAGLSAELLQEVCSHLSHPRATAAARLVCTGWRAGISLQVRTVRVRLPFGVAATSHNGDDPAEACGYFTESDEEEQELDATNQDTSKPSTAPAADREHALPTSTLQAATAGGDTVPCTGRRQGSHTQPAHQQHRRQAPACQHSPSEAKTCDQVAVQIRNAFPAFTSLRIHLPQHHHQQAADNSKLPTQQQNRTRGVKRPAAGAVADMGHSEVPGTPLGHQCDVQLPAFYQPSNTASPASHHSPPLQQTPATHTPYQQHAQQQHVQQQQEEEEEGGAAAALLGNALHTLLGHPELQRLHLVGCIPYEVLCAGSAKNTGTTPGVSSGAGSGNSSARTAMTVHHQLPNTHGTRFSGYRTSSSGNSAALHVYSGEGGSRQDTTVPYGAVGQPATEQHACGAPIVLQGVKHQQRAVASATGCTHTSDGQRLRRRQQQQQSSSLGGHTGGSSHKPGEGHQDTHTQDCNSGSRLYMQQQHQQEEGSAGSGTAAAAAACVQAGGAEPVASAAKYQLLASPCHRLQAASPRCQREGAEGTARVVQVDACTGQAQCTAITAQPGTGLVFGLQHLQQLRLETCCRLPAPCVLLALPRTLRVLVISATPDCGTQEAAGCMHGSPCTTDSIGDAHLASITHLTGLTKLQLYNVTSVTHKGLLHFTALSSLTSLALCDALDACCVGAADIQVLAQALPHVTCLSLGRATPAPYPPPIMFMGGGGGGPQPAAPAVLAAGHAYAGVAAGAGHPLPWGAACLQGFAHLTRLHVQFVHSLDEALLESLTSLQALKAAHLECNDLAYSEVMQLVEAAHSLPPVSRLTLKSCLLYDAHLEAIARCTQLQHLTLHQVDVRTRHLCSWTCLSSLTNLRSFAFKEWNNPALSVGNLAVLTDDGLKIIAAAWQQLVKLRYLGKVTLTASARTALASLPQLTRLHIVSPDGIRCVGSHRGAAGGADAGGGAPINRTGHDTGQRRQSSAQHLQPDKNCGMLHGAALGVRTGTHAPKHQMPVKQGSDGDDKGSNGSGSGGSNQPAAASCAAHHLASTSAAALVECSNIQSMHCEADGPCDILQQQQSLDCSPVHASMQQRALHSSLHVTDAGGWMAGAVYGAQHNTGEAAAGSRAQAPSHAPAVDAASGGLQVLLVLPATKLSSCNGYLTHSGTSSLNGSPGSEESVNWDGPDCEALQSDGNDDDV